MYCLLIVFMLLLARAEGQPVMVSLDGLAFTNRAEIPPGLSTIANPFSRSSYDASGEFVTDNRVKTLFPQMPIGTTLYKFSLETERFSVNVFGRRGWGKPEELLNPGDGAMILNPTRRAITVDFCTGFVQNGVAEDIPYGWSLVSCPAIDFQPAQPAPPVVVIGYSAELIPLDFPPVFIGFEPQPVFAYSFFPQDGDIVITFNQATHRFDQHTYRTASGWDRIPEVADTESFFVHTKHPRQIGLYVSMYAW